MSTNQWYAAAAVAVCASLFWSSLNTNSNPDQPTDDDDDDVSKQEPGRYTVTERQSVHDPVNGKAEEPFVNLVEGLDYPVVHDRVTPDGTTGAVVSVYKT
jgi:hypothetical protein